jgi:hypothetical protein
MKVILAAKVSGTRDNQEWPGVGTEVDIPDAEARGMIASGSAVPLDHELADSLRQSSTAGRPFEFAPPAPIESAAINDEPVKRAGR